MRAGGKDGLDYISIDKVINRFNEVLGTHWSFEIVSEDMYPQSAQGTYFAKIHGKISALGKVAHGVGADIAKDPDKAYKTALAEALKKCSHQYGVALYLWNEDDRNLLREQRSLRNNTRQLEAAGDTLAAKKSKVIELAKSRGVELTKEAMAAYFKVEDFNDEATLDLILDAQS
jgi:hypothetical protein